MTELTVRLRGSTWNHARGLAPMVATAEAYRRVVPEVEVYWEARTLQDFGSFSVTDLSHRYDLLVIDHPHLGDATRAGALIALDAILPADQLRVVEEQAVGPSYDSYVMDGHVWALPIDAAAQVSVYRPDLLFTADLPTTWRDVVRLAKRGGVLWPLKPIDAVCSFMTLAANRGTPVIAETGTFMKHDDALNVLEAMREVSANIPVECLSWDPIQALSLLADEQSEFCYIPLAFPYSNYSRPGFAARMLRVANIPGIESNAATGSLLGGAGIAVSSRCSDPTAAARHAAWVASPQVQRTTYTVSGGQPASAAAWEDERANDLTDHFFQRIRLTLDTSWLRPRHTGFPKWQDAAGDLVNAFLMGTRGASHTATALVELYERVGEGTKHRNR